MTSVITGDVINSKRSITKNWLRILKKELTRVGDSPKQWEIFRGDSFQVEIKNPTDALAFAFQLKAAFKSHNGFDVRLAIGIGKKSFNAKRITESNGSAFVNSGELVEELKRRKLDMAVRSINEKIDVEINLYIKLALITMNSWSAISAQTIYSALQHPDKSQDALGSMLKIKQNAVSTRLKRARYEELSEVIVMYKQKIKELT